MKPLRIHKGKIKCKFCNKNKAHVTMPCSCEKKVKWGNPHSLRGTKKLKEARLKLKGETKRHKNLILKQKATKDLNKAMLSKDNKKKGKSKDMNKKELREPNSN